MNAYEAQLQTRIAPCLCGGVLRALDTPEDIRQAVIEHQETRRHSGWANGIYEPSRFGPEPTFGPSALRDLSAPPTVERSAPSRSGALVAGVR